MMLEKSLHIIVVVNGMQFDFMPKKAAVDVVFILRRLNDEHCAKERKL